MWFQKKEDDETSQPLGQSVETGAQISNTPASQSDATIAAMAAASWLLSNALFVGLVRRGILTPEDAGDILNRTLNACAGSAQQAQMAAATELAGTMEQATLLVQNLAQHPVLQGRGG